MPAGESEVGDAFVAAVAAEDADRAEPLQRELEANSPSGSENDVAIRSLTAADRAVRRAANSDDEPPLVNTGEAAFNELEFAGPLRLERRRERVQETAIRAFEAAADHLGPTRGGERGHFKAPGQPAEVADHIEPSVSELVEMAMRAGKAVGAAGALGVVDSVAEARRVLQGS